MLPAGRRRIVPVGFPTLPPTNQHSLFWLIKFSPFATFSWKLKLSAFFKLLSIRLGQMVSLCQLRKGFWRMASKLSKLRDVTCVRQQFTIYFCKRLTRSSVTYEFRYGLNLAKTKNNSEISSKIFIIYNYLNQRETVLFRISLLANHRLCWFKCASLIGFTLPQTKMSIK